MLLSSRNAPVLQLVEWERSIQINMEGQRSIRISVSCGMCLVSCPFSAIVDKGQIYQTVLALKSETPVYAIVAPAIAGQFEGLKNTQIRSAFQALGFTDIREVAVGADLCTIEEAKDFLKEVPEKLPFMATSCCPA